MPKLKLDFKGNSEITTVCTAANKLEKVAKIRIQENSFSEYPLDLSLSLSKMYDSGLANENKGYLYINRNQENMALSKELSSTKSMKMRFEVKTFGCIKAFPEKLTMFDGETCKLMIRRDSNEKQKSENGVLTIKGEGSSLTFIFGVSFV